VIEPRTGTVVVLERPWAVDVDDLARELATDIRHGLSTEEAERRLARVGPNELAEGPRVSGWRMFARQFSSGMIMLLLVAAVVTAFIGDPIDSIAITAVLILNAIVGFIQEFQADRAMSALRRMTSPTTTVVRDGEPQQLRAAQVVPGDLVLLAVGDVVEADLRLTDAHTLRLNEAALTGESEPSAKTAVTLPSDPELLVAERRNIAFMGTAVTYGRGAGIAVSTGMATELGRIADLLRTHRAGPTPLQRRLAALAKRITIAVVALCAGVFALGVASGEEGERMFLTAVSLAVSAIPEGLPVMVTVALALGARRMAARRALIRSLPAVETLGSVDVICTDKTGTLTAGRMVVEHVWTPAAAYRVTGEGYAPLGVFEGQGDPEPDPESDPYLDRMARVAAACNDAMLHAPSDAAGTWTATGDPTESALLALAGKRGVSRDDIEAATPRVAEIAFDESRRRMSTLHAVAEGTWVAVKGATDAIIPMLDARDATVVAGAEGAAVRFASDGYRVLAIAERWVSHASERPASIESDLRLLGIVAMADPPRVAAEPAISACRGAGITTVMITGDDPRTAGTIARQLGIPAQGPALVTGGELDQLDDPELAERVTGIGVYARTTPEHKLRIVDAWKTRGAVVAMTGDGVNDAPALRRADIGVAMGIAGTEVSKEAADMVLADDDFATIVRAVEEGRRIYDNIRRFLRYMLATNSGEIWLWVMAFALGLPIPLLPLQILWINLVTDGLPAIALGVEPVEPDAMRRPPRPRDESIWAHGLWQHAVWVGLLMGMVGVGIEVLGRHWGMPWRTMVFTAIAFLQLGNAIAVRSERESVFHLGWRSNPWIYAAAASAIALQLLIIYVPVFQRVFDTVALSPQQLGLVVLAATITFWAIELEKLLRRRRSPDG